MGTSGGLRAPLRTSSVGLGSAGPHRLWAAARGPGAPWCSRQERTLPRRVAERPRPCAGPDRGRAPGRPRVVPEAPPSPGSDPRDRAARDPASLTRPQQEASARSETWVRFPPPTPASGSPVRGVGATPEQSLSVRFWVLLQTHNKSRPCDLFASKDASSTWRIAGCAAGRWPPPHGAIEHSKRSPAVPLT